MTSIVTVSPARNIYEQVKWKCKAYSSMFSTVLIVHVLLSLLSGGMSGSIGMVRNFVSYREQYFSLDSLFIYSVIMLLFMGWMLASQALSRDSFSIVTTNRTNAISTWLFLIVFCIFALFSAISTLSLAVFIDIMFTGDTFMFHASDISISTLVGFIVCLLLAASLGFFLHVIFDFSKIVFILLGAGFFLLVRQYSIELWGIAFGGNSVQIVGRSVIYIVILWSVILFIRQRSEVTRI